MTTPDYRRAILRAGVWREEHLVLNSGLHSDVKLEMDNLPSNPQSLRIVMRGMERLIRQRARVVVPVPRGMLKLSENLSPEKFDIVPSRKTDKREFHIAKKYHSVLQKAGSIVVAEDVVTTGGTPAAMAEAVREITPDSELHLVGIWRRGELKPEFSDHFESTAFLVEEPIPAWPPQDCFSITCKK
jgi:orotate phosphoribosyltransferase